MDYDIIRSRIAALRQELEKISVENREYYKNRHHADTIMKRAHEDRETRVIQIRAELREMLKDKLTPNRRPSSGSKHWP